MSEHFYDLNTVVILSLLKEIILKTMSKLFPFTLNKVSLLISRFWKVSLNLIAMKFHLTLQSTLKQ